MKLRLFAGVPVLVMTAGLSACSSSSGASGNSSGGSTTIDVWPMRDSVSAQFQKDFVKGFETAHPGIKVKVQIQEWDGIGEKVTAALASNDAPEVIETGNTQVAQFAQSGGLLDLSDKVGELGGGKDWLKGLAEPGAYRSPPPARHRAAQALHRPRTAPPVEDRRPWTAPGSSLGPGHSTTSAPPSAPTASGDRGATMAASSLFAAPALVVFLLLQRHVTSGFAAGAVKG